MLYLLENLHKNVLEIDSFEITKSRLVCLVWLLWWIICKLRCERPILSFKGNLWNKGQIPENCTQSWQLHYNWKYPLFYFMRCQTVNILKIFPLTGKHILFSWKQQREYCGNLLLVQTTHIMVSTKQFDQNI